MTSYPLPATTGPRIPICIHQVVEAQAEGVPEALAVQSSSRSLTYQALNQKANSVAQLLLRETVRPDTVIGLCAHRTLETLIGVLAILKAGAAYLPLDLSYPKDRLQFMLSDAQVGLILAELDTIGGLPSGQCRVLDLNGMLRLSREDVRPNPVSGVLGDNLAYIIYTSGSTGRPKGVAMSHRPLMNLLSWQGRRSGGLGPSKTLQFAPLSFGISFQEMFSTWNEGGTLVLTDEETRRDTSLLLRALRTHGVQRAFLPYVELQQFAEAAQFEDTLPTSLREIITAGERLKITPSIRKFFAKLRTCTLENQYGATECHIVTSFRLSGSPEDWPATPPIGKPIDHAEVHVLDDELCPVPQGAIGEIYIGGAPLARGYLKRPALTAERFIPSPFSTSPGGRLYKTGDLGRHLSDGSIDFVGRADHQIKHRGYRVEPGEIEATLEQHPDVEGSIVALRSRASGTAQLVAYVKPRVARPSLIGELREFLRTKLPSFMLPGRIVLLETFPVTPSGKVDYRSLPPPSQKRRDAVPASGRTRARIERLLLTWWRDILDMDKIGLNESFFDLGGDSLLATRLVSQIRRHLGANVQLASIFSNETIAKQVSLLEDKVRDDRRPAG